MPQVMIDLPSSIPEADAKLFLAIKLFELGRIADRTTRLDAREGDASGYDGALRAAKGRRWGGDGAANGRLQRRLDILVRSNPRIHNAPLGIQHGDVRG